MNSILKNSIVIFLVIILSLTLGIYSGFKSMSDYDVTSLEFEELTAEVKVYRDKYGVPSIFAENLEDLFFAEGYEFARDRLWQAEFYRSVANGELSRLFGKDLIDSDKFLKTLDFKTAAETSWDRTSGENKKHVSSYITGLNKYIDDHKAILPIEFQILSANQLSSVKPKKWTEIDAVAMQGVMSFDLSFDGMNRELVREDLTLGLGVEKALELMPIVHNQTKEYFLSLDPKTLQSTKIEQKSLKLIKNVGLGLGVGSNNWVVNGSRTKSGLPILSNDPHLGLSTPGIWWQVQLHTPNYNAEGYVLPGFPGITLGHTDYVAWGMTNTGLDSVDLFYFKTDSTGEQYYLNGTWKDFTIKHYKIPLPGNNEKDFEVKYTEYGPILDPEVFNITDDRSYVLRWTLNENHPRDRIVDALVGMNFAQNADQFLEALRYFAVPGQNFVYATIDGEIGYQFTGLVPIRTTNGSGILPQNGSSSKYGWDGMIAYEDQYRVRNPVKGYFYSANEEVDKRDKFYIFDSYSIGYRAARIETMLEEIEDITVEDMKNMQGDLLDLSAVDMLDPFMPSLKVASFDDEYKKLAENAVEILDKWDRNVVRNSTGATIFETFSVFLQELTFKDEIDEIKRYNLYEKSESVIVHTLKAISSNLTSIWFDNVNTNDIDETGSDIAQLALEMTVKYLKKKLGSNPNKWQWGRLHKVTFEHVMGDSVPLIDLNEGGKSSDGSKNTVKCSNMVPTWTEDGPDYKNSFGSSMRFIAEVESNWVTVFGLVAPGESGNYKNSHRGDGVDAWINNELPTLGFFDKQRKRPNIYI